MRLLGGSPRSKGRYRYLLEVAIVPPCIFATPGCMPISIGHGADRTVANLTCAHPEPSSRLFLGPETLGGGFSRRPRPLLKDEGLTSFERPLRGQCENGGTA
jgi:hypothetical protein